MKLGSISMFRPAFKGYEYVKDSFGETRFLFNYPFNDGDVEEKKKAKEEGKEFNGYRQSCDLKIIALKPDNNLDTSRTFVFKDIPKEGIAVDMKTLGFKKNDKFVYGFTIHTPDGNDVEARDAGWKMHGYNVVSMSALKPVVNGSGYLLMPDSFAPGYVYKGFTESNPDDIGKIVLDKRVRSEAENSRRTFSNILGGGLAGMQAKIPYLKERGIKVVFGTPITGGDSISGFKYWPENLFQLAGGIGEMNNFRDYMIELYKNGMVFVMDAPLTSEGFGGIHFQYAQRWGDTDNQMKHWFRMEDIDSNQIGYGIVGKNSVGLRHYLINAPHEFKEKDGQIIYDTNYDYDSSKPTIIQYYDKDYVSPETVAKKQPLEKFDKLSADNPLQTATHDDTVVNFNVAMTKSDYKAYLKNIDTLNERNRNSKDKLEFDSREGTIYVSNFPRTRLADKSAAGVVTWDANTDMIKLRYFESAYDYKSKNEQLIDEFGLTPANNEIQDMSIKFGKYWSSVVKQYHELYTAQTLGSPESALDAHILLSKLVEHKKLPIEAKKLDLEAMQMIDEDLYNISTPELSAETLIDKLVMDLPLESLELDKYTLGVLSTNYFTARATNKKQQGMSRYELAQNGNPQFTKELEERFGYSKVYNKVNDMLTGEVHDFVRAVLERTDEELPADKKIFKDSAKNILTPYGYYVTKFVAGDAARYILLRSLVPKMEVKSTSDGQIIYDYDKLRNESSLSQLGVKGHTPKYEAELLAARMHSGLKEFNTDSEEIDFVKNAVLNRVKDINLRAFKYSEAIVNGAGLGLRYRIDALKDTEDIDSLRNKGDYPSKVRENLISFWRKFKDNIAEVTTDTVIYDEITDTDLLKDSGDSPSPAVELMQTTEHTTEAAYDFFFTDFLKMFTGDPAKAGVTNGYTGGNSFNGLSETQNAINKQLRALFERQYPLEYFRSLYTFGGNHDKPRLAHCMMVDMKMVQAVLNQLNINDSHREEALLAITGAADMNDLPFDVQYNYENTDYINKNYFTGASTLAIATGKAIRDAIHEFLGQRGIISAEELNSLHRAVTSLVNGNFTLEPEKRASFIDYCSAINEIVDMAVADGLQLRQDDKYDVRPELIEAIVKEAKENVKNIKSTSSLKSYTPYFNDSGVPQQILVLCNVLWGAAEKKLNELHNHYSSNGDDNPYKYKDDMLAKMRTALEKYMHKYDSIDIANDLDTHQLYLMTRNDNERTAFGASDMREAIRLVFTKAGLDAKTDTQFKLYKEIADPAVAKVRMYMRILGLLPGVPTLYGGDEFGMSGYEEKAKNVELQNRNALPFSKLEGDSEESEYYRKINDDFKEISNLRKEDGVLSPLNNGTPYYLNPQYADGRILPTVFTMDSSGSSVLSLFNMSGLSANYKYNYYQGQNYDSKTTNPYIPQIDEVELGKISLGTDSAFHALAGLSLATGLVFTNIIKGDNTIYKVVKDGAAYCIKRFEKLANGALKEINIKLDSGTMKDGAFTLYHKVRGARVHFKGGSHREYYNPQYNIVSNPYHYLNEHSTCGKKLSVISK